MSRTANLDLAVIGNCQIAALVDRAGSIIWACLPRLDGDPVFSALLSPIGDGDRGAFCIRMEGTAQVRQRYLPATAVVETTYEGDAASLRILDFCPRFMRGNQLYRPALIVRIIEPLRGEPLIRVRLAPTADYGGSSPRASMAGDALRFVADDCAFRMTTDGPLVQILEGRPFTLKQPLTCIFGLDEPLAGSAADFGRAALDQTCRHWEQWIRGLSIPQAYREPVIRAAITLQLCTYEETGAVLAALTTSVPEAPDTLRNWDYRFCWLRDSYFTAHALDCLGAAQTMEAYLHFIHDTHVRTPAQDLQPLYGIDGQPQLTEVAAPALRGYRSMGPVRVGNQAFEQKQNDMYGAVVLAAAQLFFDDHLDIADHVRVFRRLERLGECAIRVFSEPDSGPWELRRTDQVHTYSAIMCWVACDRLAQIAVRVGDERAAAHWRKQADAMHERIIAEAWNARLGSFVATFGGDTLDASLLLIAELRFVPAADARFIATVDAVGKELRTGDLLFRYREADDFGVPATTFTVCAFWYVNALAAIGRIREARELFDKLLERRNGFGLLSEDIDPSTGELWGNFPQTYSMVGIIVSALRVSRPSEDLA